MRVCLLFTTFLFLSGCLDPPTPEDEPFDFGPVEVPPSAQRATFEESFSLLIQPDVFLVPTFSGNCVYFDNQPAADEPGAGFTLFNGSLHLTWDEAPNMPEFILRTVSSSQQLASDPGGSPLELSFELLEMNEARWGLGFWVDYSLLRGALPVKQEATLDLTFQYEGDLPPPLIATCKGGGV